MSNFKIGDLVTISDDIKVTHWIYPRYRFVIAEIMNLNKVDAQIRPLSSEFAPGDAWQSAESYMLYGMWWGFQYLKLVCR